MTTHTIKGCVAFSCDDCSEDLETGETDFALALSQAKRGGWRPEKTPDGWEHRCPDCAQVRR